MYLQGTASFSDTTFEQSSAHTGRGGAISAPSATGVALLRCCFDGNQASGTGGACFLQDVVSASDCE